MEKTTSSEDREVERVLVAALSADLGEPVDCAHLEFEQRVVHVPVYRPVPDRAGIFITGQSTVGQEFRAACIPLGDGEYEVAVDWPASPLLGQRYHCYLTFSGVIAEGFQPLLYRLK
jgi:hypothetical protein